jgi:hypothetical protein
MVTPLAKTPVPVRLSLRYSNGIVLTHNARALRYDEDSLRVLSNQPFEQGAALSVLAPFFDGITTCWVFGISKSPEQPGYFELDLQFAKKPIFVSQSPVARRKLPRHADRVAAQEAIDRLITGLYRLPPPPFSQVIRELLSELHPTALAASGAAVIFLLHEKGIVNLGRLVHDVREATKQ